MENELVSIVIPIFRTEKYLNRCVESVLGQTYSNIEVLLIDDGSPDACPEMCEEWAKKDARISVYHQKNMGLGMARNTGLKNARGKYICFFDSDDYIDRDLIRKAHALAVENDADVVTFGFTYVDASGKITGRGIPRYAMEGISACTRLLSMDLLKRADFSFVSERELISEDYYAKLCLEQHVRKAVMLPEPLYYYCRNAGSLTQTFHVDRQEKNKVFYCRCTELVTQQGREPERHDELLDWFISATIVYIKQTVSTKSLTKNEKYRLLVATLCDELVQQAISEGDQKPEGIRRKLLFGAIKKQWACAVYFLAWLQTRKS